MNMSHEQNDKSKFRLPVEFVRSDYFLCRIREFEQQYAMGWGDFLAQYSKGNLQGNAITNRDYAEWAFLCHNFMLELVRMEGPGPPGHLETEVGREPESISGSFIWGDLVRCSRLFRDCGECDWQFL
jgi:hypothetical protein